MVQETEYQQKKQVLGREKLKREKPLVYEKIIRYDEKIARGESVANLDFTFDYTCNMKCSHCSNLSFLPKERSMTIADVKSLADQMDALGMGQLVISGGEPLTFPNLDEIIATIDPRRFHITLNTNGMLLSEEKSREIKAMGIDKVRVSVDNFDKAKYAQTRKNEGAYDKALEALFHAKKAGLAVAIGTAISHQSCKTPETEALAEFAQENNFHVDIYCMKAIGALEGKEEVLLTPDDSKYLLNLRETYPVMHRDVYPTFNSCGGCRTVEHNLHVTKYGDVLPCVFIHISIGNIFEEPLEDIIKRGFSIKWFREPQTLCLSGEHKGFIRNYMSKFYGKPLPVSYKDVFTEKDYI